MSDEIANLRERVAVNEQKASTAHTRIDKLELLMKEELTAIKLDVKTVLGYFERSKGMIAVISVIAGFIGWLINQAISFFFHITK